MDCFNGRDMSHNVCSVSERFPSFDTTVSVVRTRVAVKQALANDPAVAPYMYG